MKDAGKILLGFAAGAAVGAIAGILFAPAKGSETRQKLLDSAGELADALKEKAGDSMEALSSLKDSVLSKNQESQNTHV